MTDRPILFSAPMVRALLAGTKTQTRRAVKLKAWHTVEERDNGQHWPWMYDGERNADYWLPCPYGQPGDRLWVRETWMDLQGTGVEHRDLAGKLQRYSYAADTPPGSYGDETRKDFGLKWRPSIHMARIVSRITLEVTGVRVERLQDISEADAKAEGVSAKHTADADYTAREAYSVLWEQINGPGTWDANPWVWVVEFKRAAAALPGDDGDDGGVR